MKSNALRCWTGENRLIEIDTDTVIRAVKEQHKKSISIIWEKNDMARSPIAKHDCTLYGRNIIWPECYEVQEAREDEMDAKWLREPFDMEKAGRTCEKCKWFVVGKDE